MSIEINVNDTISDMGLWLKGMPRGVMAKAVRSSLKRTKPTLKRESFKRAKELRNVSNKMLKEKNRTEMTERVSGDRVDRMFLSFRFSSKGIGLRNFQQASKREKLSDQKGRYRGFGVNRNKLKKRRPVVVTVVKGRRTVYKHAWVGRGKNNNILVLQRNKHGKVISLSPVFLNLVMAKARAHEPILKRAKPVFVRNLTSQIKFRVSREGRKLARKKA